MQNLKGKEKAKEEAHMHSIELRSGKKVENSREKKIFVPPVQNQEASEGTSKHVD